MLHASPFFPPGWTARRPSPSLTPFCGEEKRAATNVQRIKISHVISHFREKNFTFSTLPSVPPLRRELLSHWNRLLRNCTSLSLSLSFSRFLSRAVFITIDTVACSTILLIFFPSFYHIVLPIRKEIFCTEKIFILWRLKVLSFLSFNNGIIIIWLTPRSPYNPIYAGTYKAVLLKRRIFPRKEKWKKRITLAFISGSCTFFQTFPPASRFPDARRNSPIHRQEISARSGNDKVRSAVREASFY